MATDYQSLLSTRYAMDILALIYENESIMATSLLRIAKNYTTVSKTVNLLHEAGLVEISLESDKRLMKIYRLTPKGAALGRRAYECREILFDHMPYEEKTAVETKEKKGKKKSKS